MRLPAGERVEVAVRSTSSRTATLVEGSVSLDGTSLLRHTWTNADERRRAKLTRTAESPPTKRPPETEPNVELLGYAQPCVAHAGETVEVKVSTTQPGFTAEVVRLGLAAEPVVPRVAGGDFPGRQQELRSGSYLIAELGEPTDAESSVQFWFFPTLLAGRQCLMAGFCGGRRLGGGHLRRAQAQLRAPVGRG